MKKITYKISGVDYDSLDPIKKLAQESAEKTSKNLSKHGFKELSDSRGESAYVWKQGKALMASVIEGLGTKNLIADELYKLTGKNYYDVIAQDTVATIINDLVSVGATPLVLHAYWATGSNDWIADEKRMSKFISSWKKACNVAGVSWGGGETPTLKNIINEKVADLGGSAIGIINNEKNYLNDKKIKEGDRIILIKSNGVNANGISLTRAIAKKLPKGYLTKLPNGKTYGESLLTPSNIYAKLIQDLQKSGVDIHYISNITGHGLRKIMRGRPNFSYKIEKIFEPQEIFKFIQKNANLSDEEMYGTYNMGQDYCLIINKKDVERCLKITKSNRFSAIDSGEVLKGEKRVEILPKNIVFQSQALSIR